VETVTPEALVAGLLPGPDPQSAGMGRAPGKRLRKAIGALNPREALFVAGYVKHRGDCRQASVDAGYSPNEGYKIVKRERVQTAIQRLVAQVEHEVGVDLGKSRILEDLDRTLTRVSHAFDREAEVRISCPNCLKSSMVKLRAAPREVAQLGVAMARTLEVAAKITGAMAPQQVHHSRGPDVEGSYPDLVRLVQENPKAFSFEQQQALRQTALLDRLAIDVLLSLIATEVVTVRAMLPSGDGAS